MLSFIIANIPESPICYLKQLLPMIFLILRSLLLPTFYCQVCSQLTVFVRLIWPEVNISSELMAELVPFIWVHEAECLAGEVGTTWRWSLPTDSKSPQLYPEKMNLHSNEASIIRLNLITHTAN